MSKPRVVEIKITVTYDPVTGKDVALCYAPCQDLMDLLHVVFAIEKSFTDLVDNLKSGNYTESELRKPEGIAIRGDSTGVKNFDKAMNAVKPLFKKPFAES